MKDDPCYLDKKNQKKRKFEFFFDLSLKKLMHRLLTIYAYLLFKYLLIPMFTQLFFLIYRARDSFEGTFTQAPLDALRYLSESDFVEKTMKLQGTQPVETFEKVKKVLVDDLPKNFEDCLSWARHLFQDLFHNQIAQLLHNFPADQTTSSG